jgi:superfamily II DNA/RNA helicase
MPVLTRAVCSAAKVFAAIEREAIKSAVKKREIRLVVATDAACEGLKLKSLGTFINVDLPWNPSRPEQRLERIKRFRQTCRTVNMLNLVYHETQDEKIYRVLSRRMKDRYDIFGGLPDTIEDEWIDSVEKLEERMDTYIHLHQQARDVFEMRYQETTDPDGTDGNSVPECWQEGTLWNVFQYRGERLAVTAINF